MIWAKGNYVEVWAGWNTLEEKSQGLYCFFNTWAIHRSTSVKNKDEFSRCHFLFFFLVSGCSNLGHKADKSSYFIREGRVFLKEYLWLFNLGRRVAERNVLGNDTFFLQKGEMMSFLIGGTFCQIKFETWHYRVYGWGRSQDYLSSKESYKGFIEFWVLDEFEGKVKVEIVLGGSRQQSDHFHYDCGSLARLELPNR